MQVPCQIVKLVLRNNALTSLHGIENLKSLQGLDVSYNIISNFSEIEVLAGISSLQNLWLEGNPLCYARWFRAKVFSLIYHPYLVSRWLPFSGCYLLLLDRICIKKLFSYIYWSTYFNYFCSFVHLNNWYVGMYCSLSWTRRKYLLVRIGSGK